MKIIAVCNIPKDIFENMRILVRARLHDAQAIQLLYIASLQLFCLVAMKPLRVVGLYL